MPQKASKKSKSPKLICTLQHTIVLLYTIMMFVVFPFFLTAVYSKARRDKFWFFVVLTAIVAVCVIFIVLADYFSRKKLDVINDFKAVLKNFNITDIAIISFFLINLISAVIATINGGDFNSYLIGTEGRNMGVLMHLMLTIAYFMVSRLFFIKKYFIELVMLGMGIMTFLAVVNFYYIDPLGAFKSYSNNTNVMLNFTSTIGNKNMLSAMICVALPFSVGAGIVANSKSTRIFSYVSVGLQFMGLIVATSDGGFLGCFVSLLVLLVLSSKDLKRLSRYFICLAVMIGSSKLLWLFDMAMDGNNKGYTSFSETFMFNHYLTFLLPIFIGLAVLFEFLKDENKLITKILFRAFLILLALIFVFSIVMFVVVSNNDDMSADEGLLSFFKFDEDWGTHRGYFWIKSFKIFDDFDLREKLFGCGPDSYRGAFAPYNSELLQKYGESATNAAHSVYINYLITVGILGIGAYLLFVGSSLLDAFRFSTSNSLAFICLGVMVSYFTQDIVNIANPINTPWLIIFVAICQSVRKTQNQSIYVSDCI